MTINPRLVRLASAAVAAAVLFAACGGGGSGDGGGGVPLCEVAATGAVPTPAPANPPEVSGEIVTTDSGLTYVDVCQGRGEMPQATDQVEVYYTGYLQETGAKFDSSVDRGRPEAFSVSGLIAGFTEGLLSMREGGIRRLIIPGDLGYGPAGNPNAGIPPNAILIFDVQLVAIDR